MTTYELKIVSKPYSLGGVEKSNHLGGRKLVYKTSKLLGTEPILPSVVNLPKILQFKFFFKDIIHTGTVVFWNPLKDLLPKNVRHKDFGKKDNPLSNKWYVCRNNFRSVNDRHILSQVKDNKLVKYLSKETNKFVL